MKTLIALLAVSTVCLTQVQGQDAKTGETAAEIQTPKPKTPSQVAVPQASERGAKTIERKVTYGGFLAEVAKAENKAQALSLRNPADPRRDEENVFRDPQTRQARGWVLFAIRF